MAKYTGDFNVDVALGKLQGVSYVQKFGHNEAIGVNTLEDVWSAGGPYRFPINAAKLNIYCSNAGDTAAGNGARKILVQGLDQNWEEITETISTSGATYVTSVNSFFRVYRAYVTEVGIYVQSSTSGANMGQINVYHDTASNLLATIPYDAIDKFGYGQTQMAVYTIPKGKKAVIFGGRVAIESTKIATFYFKMRQNADAVAANFSPARVISELHGVDSYVEVDWHPGILVPGKTDLWASCRASAAAAVSAQFDLILVDDDSEYKG